MLKKLLGLCLLCLMLSGCNSIPLAEQSYEISYISNDNGNLIPPSVRLVSRDGKLSRPFSALLAREMMPIYSAVWLPDGNRVAFVTIDLEHDFTRPGYLKLNVCSETTCKNFSEYINMPLSDNHIESYAWSTDGKKVAFISGSGNSAKSITVFDVESSSMEEFLGNDYDISHYYQTDDGSYANESPRLFWSPDSRQLVLDLYDSSTGWIVSILDITDGTVTPIAPGRSPCWSPVSAEIVYVYEGNLFIYNLNTYETTQITSDGQSGWASWSPDAEWIVFQSERDGNLDIYVMARDGKNITRLTDNAGFDIKPEWRMAIPDIDK